MLGSVEEKRILELGAGIGRFTGHLAATARSVLAVDFMENLIEENKRANSHRSVSAQILSSADFHLLVLSWTSFHLRRGTPVSPVGGWGMD